MTFEDAREKLNSCKYLYLESFGRGDRDLDLRVEIVEARPQKGVATLPLGSDILEGILGPGTPIAPDSGSAYFTLVFKDYIGFSIVNESWANGDKEKSLDTGPDKGHKLFRKYEKSHFREYLSSVTFATEKYPGPQKHFEINCLNHVINVVCENDPIITITTLGEISAARTS